MPTSKGHFRARKIRAGGSWSQSGAELRIIEIRRKKLDIIESKNEIISALKKSHAYDRRQVWRRLRKSFEEIKRLRIAA